MSIMWRYIGLICENICIRVEEWNGVVSVIKRVIVVAFEVEVSGIYRLKKC